MSNKINISICQPFTDKWHTFVAATGLHSIENMCSFWYPIRLLFNILCKGFILLGPLKECTVKNDDIAGTKYVCHLVIIISGQYYYRSFEIPREENGVPYSASCPCGQSQPNYTTASKSGSGGKPFFAFIFLKLVINLRGVISSFAVLIMSSQSSLFTCFCRRVLWTRA